MELKVKRLVEDAILPVKAHNNDAGFDLFVHSIESSADKSGKMVLVYKTGIAVEIPDGYVGLLFQRSSVADRSISLCNAVGVIDAGYRGEIIGKFKVTTDAVPSIYVPGDKFLQLVVVALPEVTVVEVEDLSASERWDSGFGSTDDDASANTNADNLDQCCSNKEELCNCQLK